MESDNPVQFGTAKRSGLRSSSLSVARTDPRAQDYSDHGPDGDEDQASLRHDQPAVGGQYSIDRFHEIAPSDP